jgi:hypothetical protein
MSIEITCPPSWAVELDMCNENELRKSYSDGTNKLSKCLSMRSAHIERILVKLYLSQGDKGEK